MCYTTWSWQHLVLVIKRVFNHFNKCNRFKGSQNPFCRMRYWFNTKFWKKTLILKPNSKILDKCVDVLSEASLIVWSVTTLRFSLKILDKPTHIPPFYVNGGLIVKGNIQIDDIMFCAINTFSIIQNTFTYSDEAARYTCWVMSGLTAYLAGIVVRWSRPLIPINGERAFDKRQAERCSQTKIMSRNRRYLIC